MQFWVQQGISKMAGDVFVGVTGMDAELFELMPEDAEWEARGSFSG